MDVAAVSNAVVGSPGFLIFSIVFMVLWVGTIIWAVVMYFVRVRPLVRELQKTPEGRMRLVKIMFPPRFHR